MLNYRLLRPGANQKRTPKVFVCDVPKQGNASTGFRLNAIKPVAIKPVAIKPVAIKPLNVFLAQLRNRRDYPMQGSITAAKKTGDWALP